MKALKNNWVYFVSIFLNFVILIVLSLSLFSFSPLDNSIFYYNSSNVGYLNWMGFLGAHISAVLFWMLGYVAYGIPLFFLIFAIIIFGKKVLKNLDVIFAYIAFLAFLSTYLAFWGSSFSGYIGYKLNIFLLNIFDPVLSKIILLSLMLFSFLIFTHLSFVQIFNFLFHVLRTLQKYSKPVFLSLKNLAFWIGLKIKNFSIWVRSCFNGKILIDEAGQDIEYQDLNEESKNFWLNYFSKNVDVDILGEVEKTVIKEVEYENNQIEKIERASIVSFDDNENLKKEKSNYVLPSLNIFTAVKEFKEELKKDLEDLAQVLQSKLERFGINGKVTAIKHGPVVTLFEYQPDADSKLSKIVALEDDLAMALEAKSIRIIAPIPGTSFVGFEVANKNPSSVYFSNVIHSDEYKNFKGSLPLVLGEDIIGRSVVVDLAKMPHLLVAGSTGSGKSVALNTMLVSLLCKHNPDELKLILIDPKRLEFSSYHDIAHLIFPIVTQVKDANGILKWLVKKMEDRYDYMAKLGIKNIFDYHEAYGQEAKKKMPFIVLVIDELSDLMMTVGKEVEVQIARIAQMARAAGIHMILATQRPSVDVITGLIKVNFPSRISFRVTSKVDSRTILDCVGAEKLLGRGDMLFLNSSAADLERVHGAYISTKEINSVVNYIRSQKEVEYEILNQNIINSDSEIEDELFDDVVSFLEDVDEVSISLIQRRFRIGYNRSARLIEKLEEIGYILPADGGKMRKVVKDL